MIDSSTALSTAPPIDIVLPALANVRQTGADRWIASCPGPNHEHGDRHPSLGIKACADGVVLVRCYSGGCDVRDILSAINLDIRDLFPSRITDRQRLNERERIPLRDLLRIIGREVLVVLLAGEHLRDGIALTANDLDRLRLAVGRIGNALDCAGVR